MQRSGNKPVENGQSTPRPLIADVLAVSQITTGKGTTLPPISGLSGTRGSERRLSLTRVANEGQLTQSKETVVARFLGCVVFLTFDGTTYSVAHAR